MNANNTNQVLSNCLSTLTYNGSDIAIPKDHHLNLYMGLGLWSQKDKLSEGLPIDVMQMLLSAAIMKMQIQQTNPGKQPKVILLIADSMAASEAKKEQADAESIANTISQITQVYKESLKPLIDLLHMKESAEIVLLSELQERKEYQTILDEIKNSKHLKDLKLDQKSTDYVTSQTAITRYMSQHRDVGIKVGWILESSKEKIKKTGQIKKLQWDELKFDICYKKIVETKDLTMQYLYAKAGLKQDEQRLIEGCPYTGYAKHQPYIIQTQTQKDIATINPIQVGIVHHWKGIAQVCSHLMQAHLVNSQLLPKDCIQDSDESTIYGMLNYWSNIPIASQKTSDIDIHASTPLTN